jgi:predicted ArsR family transcriptional regulator
VVVEAPGPRHLDAPEPPRPEPPPPDPLDPGPLDERVAEVAALDQPLRRDLYALVVGRGGWVSRDEATEALDVARSVAAFHLDRLADAGLLDVRFVRPEGRSGPGAGRPAKQYRRAATEVAVSIPERRYDLAGTLLTDAIADADATGQPIGAALRAAAHRTGREAGQAWRVDVGPGDDGPGAAGRGGHGDPQVTTMTALGRLGYEPREHEGEIVLANCPFHRLAERHRDLVCGMNLDLLDGLSDGLGTADELEPRLEPAEGLCCVRIGRRSSSAGETRPA